MSEFKEKLKEMMRRESQDEGSQRDAHVREYYRVKIDEKEKELRKFSALEARQKSLEKQEEILENKRKYAEALQFNKTQRQSRLEHERELARTRVAKIPRHHIHEHHVKNVPVEGYNRLRNFKHKIDKANHVMNNVNHKFRDQKFKKSFTQSYNYYPKMNLNFRGFKGNNGFRNTFQSVSMPKLQLSFSDKPSKIKRNNRKYRSRKRRRR